MLFTLPFTVMPLSKSATFFYSMPASFNSSRKIFQGYHIPFSLPTGELNHLYDNFCHAPLSCLLLTESGWPGCFNKIHGSPSLSAA
jgi:hypothetical protein